MKLTLRKIGAAAWCLGVVCASLAARNQSAQKPARDASAASPVAAADRAPAWIEGFSAGFEPVVQMSGEIVEFGGGRRRTDTSGWTAVGEASVDAVSVHRATGRALPPGVEIPSWVDLSPSSSIMPRQPQSEGTVQAQYLPAEQPAPEREDGWTAYLSGDQPTRRSPVTAQIESGSDQSQSAEAAFDKPIPLAPPPSDLMPEQTTPPAAARPAPVAARQQQMDHRISALKTERPIPRAVERRIPDQQPARQAQPVFEPEPSVDDAPQTQTVAREPDFVPDELQTAAPSPAAVEEVPVVRIDAAEEARIARIRGVLSQLKGEAAERAKMLENARRAKAAAEAAEAAAAAQAAAAARAAALAEEAANAERARIAAEQTPKPVATPAPVTVAATTPAPAPVAEHKTPAGPSAEEIRVTRIQAALEIYRQQQEELSQSKGVNERAAEVRPVPRRERSAPAPSEGEASEAPARAKPAPVRTAVSQAETPDSQTLARIARLEKELAALKSEAKLNTGARRKPATPSRPTTSGSQAARSAPSVPDLASESEAVISASSEHDAPAATQADPEVSLESARLGRLEAELAALDAAKAERNARRTASAPRPAATNPAAALREGAPAGEPNGSGCVVRTYRCEIPQTPGAAPRTTGAAASTSPATSNGATTRTTAKPVAPQRTTSTPTTTRAPTNTTTTNATARPAPIRGSGLPGTQETRPMPQLQPTPQPTRTTARPKQPAPQPAPVESTQKKDSRGSLFSWIHAPSHASSTAPSSRNSQSPQRPPVAARSDMRNHTAPVIQRASASDFDGAATSGANAGQE